MNLTIDHIGRIKVVNKKVFEGLEKIDLYWMCICPHCGRQVMYKNMMKTSGINNCIWCNEEVNKQIEFDKKTDYSIYERKANNFEYEPYRYTGEDND